MVSLGVYLYHAFGDRVRERFGWADRFRLPVNENVALYVVSIPFAALALYGMIAPGTRAPRLFGSTTGKHGRHHPGCR